MGRYTNRSGLPKLRIGGRRSYRSNPIIPITLQEPTREFTKEELFMATMKFIIQHGNKIKHEDVQYKIMKHTRKSTVEAINYLQELLNRGYISKEFIGYTNHISVTKKACDKIRAIKEG